MRCSILDFRALWTALTGLELQAVPTALLLANFVSLFPETKRSSPDVTQPALVSRSAWLVAGSEVYFVIRQLAKMRWPVARCDQ